MFTPAVSGADPQFMMVNCDMSGAYTSVDGGRNWQMINCLQLRSNTQCRPAFHPVDPRTVFAANGWSGMAVSHDKGEHWRPIGSLTGALIGDIVIDDGKPDNMLAATADNVYLSADGGKTWTACQGIQGRYLGGHFDQTSPSSRRTCFVGTQSGVYRSDDGGATWKQKTNNLNNLDLFAFAAASNRVTGKVMLYCTDRSSVVNGVHVGGVYRSFDRGETWRNCTGKGINLDLKAFDQWSMGPVAQYLHLATSNADPYRVYVTNSNTGVPPPHHATVFRSDDAGGEWKYMFMPDPRYPGFNVEKDYTVTVDGQFYQDVPNIAVSAGDPSKIVMVNGGCLYTSVDGAKTWSCGHTRSAASIPGEGPMWTCSGLVVTSTWNYYVDPFEPNRHYICYTDIGFARSLNRGKSWEWWDSKGRAPWQNTCFQLAFDPKVAGRVWGAFSNVHDIPNGNIIYGSHRATGDGGVCVSDDYGATWKPCNGLPLGPTTSIAVDAFSPRSARTLYVGQFGNGVFRSDDGGVTWVAKNNGLGSDGNKRVNRVVLHPDGTLFAVVTQFMRNNQFSSDGVGIYRSKDKGEHWTKINQSQPFLWPKDLTVDPNDSRILYVGAADARADQAGLWRTVDGGQTWTRILKQGPEHFGAYLSPTHKGWIYATLTEGAPKAGLWLSKDNGQTWASFDDFPFANAQRVAFDPTDPAKIYVTTFGAGIWRGPASP